jgi:hypothetical protein
MLHLGMDKARQTKGKRKTRKCQGQVRGKHCKAWSRPKEGKPMARKVKGQGKSRRGYSNQVHDEGISRYGQWKARQGEGKAWSMQSQIKASPL